MLQSLIIALLVEGKKLDINGNIYEYIGKSKDGKYLFNNVSNILDHRAYTWYQLQSLNADTVD